MRQRHAQAYLDRVFARYGAKSPKVKIRRTPGYGWHGRFVPEANRIELAIGRAVGEPEQRAVLVHEAAHGLAREIEKKRRADAAKANATAPSGGAKRRTRLTYEGQHDRHFYGVTRALHERAGTTPETATFVERASGYSEPKSWRKALKLGRWKMRWRRRGTQ